MHFQRLVPLALMVLGGIRTASAKVHTVNLHSTNGVYYTNITLGTPPQEFRALVDTSSANVWVPGTHCSRDCQSKLKYNYSASSTYKANGTKVNLFLSWSFVSGEISQDTLMIGDLLLPNQGFAEARFVSGLDEEQSIDGFLGLGKDAISVQQVVPPFYNAINNGLLDEPKFAIYLDKNVKNPEHAGELTLGGYDNSRFEGDISWLSVLPQKSWEVNLTSLTIGTHSIPKAEPVSAVFDTSLDRIGLSLYLAADIYTEIGAEPDGHGDFTVDCASRSTLPDLTFGLDGKNFTISPYDYIEETSGTCRPAFVILDMPDSEIPPAHMGTRFLRKFYSIYDLERNAVGLAKAV